MPFPTDLTVITVTATYEAIDGTAASGGSVTFDPGGVIADNIGKAIFDRPATVLLQNGTISVQLPATDNANLNPTGFSYAVTEKINGTTSRMYTIQLPSSLGTTVDLAQLAPVAEPPAPTAQAGGDLSGRYPNPSVIATHLTAPLPPVQGGTGLSTAGSDGEVLTADGAGGMAWQPAGTSAVSGDLTGSLPAPQVAATHLAEPLPVDQGGTGIAAAGAAGTVLTSAADGSLSYQPVNGAMMPAAVQTAAYNAEPGDLVPCDISGGSLTVTLPQAPPAGTTVAVIITAASGGHALTVAAQGADTLNTAGGPATITLSAPFQAATFRYSSGFWYSADRGPDWLNVKSFGAKGDGTTDDTAAIQKALTAAGNAGGGTVYVPAGTYKTGPLTIPQNVTLRGAGIAATTLQLAPTVSQYGNLIMNQQLAGTSYDANCVQVRDLRIDGNKSAMSAGWRNCGIVLSNRTPSGGFEYTDGRHQVSNVLIQNFTGDGLVQAGRGVVQASDVQAWVCNGFGFNLNEDSEYVNCDAGACGLDGFIIQGGSNRLTGCKAWFSGAALVSGRGAGATLLTVTAPPNSWDGGNITGGLTFSLANGYGNGFLWRNISGTSVASNSSGGSYSALGAQDNARAGFLVQGARQTLTGIEADSNGNCGTTSGLPNGTYAGVEANCSNSIIIGTCWDRAANVNHQGAALRLVSSSGTNTRNRIQLGFSGSLNDSSNMPPLTADSTLYQNSVQFQGMSGSFQNPSFTSSFTPDPFAAEVFAPGALTGNVTISNPALAGTNTTGLFLVPGMKLTLILTQDGTGGRTVALGAAFRLNGKSFSTAAGATTVITFIYDGASWQA
jgi:hypothetical protein